MRVIGLTGGIASGKSTVAKILEQLGAAVIDADQLSREAVLPGMPAHAEIVAAFGDSILTGQGTIDRKRLAELVFTDDEARKRLEGITHPAIRKLAEARLSALREKKVPIAVYMAPLLFEAGVADRMDEVWVVYSDRETQIRRAMSRDGMSRHEVEQRLDAQMPIDEKVRRGTLVIENMGGIEELKDKVRVIWERELQRRGAGG